MKKWINKLLEIKIYSKVLNKYYFRITLNNGEEMYSNSKYYMEFNFETYCDLYLQKGVYVNKEYFPIESIKSIKFLQSEKILWYYVDDVIGTPKDLNEYEDIIINNEMIERKYM